ncbi:hypothetical protein [Vibrio phage vB_ValM-yong1]|uniref:Uncharacterized protein n=1 Tax=Vibrio phage vB_ValM-yong1 TaxID=2660715 RepID=A0A6M3A3F2_9CAUD|nr:hypothetical protein HYQ07_gp06 [Vibrio phage Valm-yong1]QGF21276.1 hypothetical protein [Vibrio phage Valm-yong1]
MITFTHKAIFIFGFRENHIKNLILITALSHLSDKEST